MRLTRLAIAVDRIPKEVAAVFALSDPAGRYALSCHLQVENTAAFLVPAVVRLDGLRQAVAQGVTPSAKTLDDLWGLSAACAHALDDLIDAVRELGEQNARERFNVLLPLMDDLALAEGCANAQSRVEEAGRPAAAVARWCRETLDRRQTEKHTKGQAPSRAAGRLQPKTQA